MQTDKMTPKTQAALQSAKEIALDKSHQELDGEHLLLALLQQDDGLVKPLLQRLAVNLSALQTGLESEFLRRNKVSGAGASDVFLSAGIKKTLDSAGAEARKLKDDFISTEHLLLGLIDEGGECASQTSGTRCGWGKITLAQETGSGVGDWACLRVCGAGEALRLGIWDAVR